MNAILLALACAGPGDEPADKTPSPVDTDAPPMDTDVTEDTDAPADTDVPEDTDVTEPVEPADPCAPAAVDVLSATVTQPWHENEARIELVLSAPASVAVQCALGGDPAEIHLAEGGAESVAHTLDVAGLLGDATYDCLAAPVCPSSLGEPLAFSFTTGPVNPLLPATDVTVTGDHGDEYVLANHADDCTWRTNRLVVFDRAGRPRWWADTPEFVGPSLEFRYHGDGVFAWGGGWKPNSDGRPRRIDVLRNELYDSGIAIPDLADAKFHHDGKQLPDGRLLTLEEVEIVEADGGTFEGFQVRRIDPLTSTVDFTYDGQRAYDEGHLPGGVGDAWHANWMDIVEIDGQEVLAVSFCILQQVAFIDVATGEWLGLLGAGGDFTVTDSAGEVLGDIGYMECQHGLEIENTTLLAYDNGIQRGYSRIVEYELDLPAKTAELTYTWTEPDWWETTLGDVDRLPSGDLLVAMSHAECFSSNKGDHPTIVEVDVGTGANVWQLQYVPKGETFYRADFADPCDLFQNTAYCPAISDRLAELAVVFQGAQP